MVELTGIQGHRFFAEPRDTALEPADLHTSLERAPGAYRLTVTAHKLVRDLALLIDRVDPDGRVDDMLVTLLPGERFVFFMTSNVELTAAELSTPFVLRSAKQVVAVE